MKREGYVPLPGITMVIEGAACRLDAGGNTGHRTCCRRIIVSASSRYTSIRCIDDHEGALRIPRARTYYTDCVEH